MKIETTSALKEALQAAQTGVHVLPDNPDVHFNLGRAYLRMARRDEAAQEFREFLRLAKPGPLSDSRSKYVNDLLHEMAPYLSP